MKQKIILFIIAALLIWMASCNPGIKYVAKTYKAVSSKGDTVKVTSIYKTHYPYKIRKSKDSSITYIKY